MKKNIKKYVFGLFIGCLTMGMTVSATEYSVTLVDMILYSNTDAVLYVDADLTSDIVLLAENFQDNIPIHVTGITSNGFFQVDLGAIYYVPGNGLEEQDITTSVVDDSESAVMKNTTAESTKGLEGYENVCGQVVYRLQKYNNNYNKKKENQRTLQLTGCYKATTIVENIFGVHPVNQLYGYQDIAVVECSYTDSLGISFDEVYLVTIVNGYSKDGNSIPHANGTYTFFKQFPIWRCNPEEHYTKTNELNVENVLKYAKQMTE